MSLRPLTPQSPARIEWEQHVTRRIEELADMTTSDVQAMLEADPDGVDRVFGMGLSTPDAAHVILGHSEPPQAEQSGLDILNAEGFNLLEVASDATDEAMPEVTLTPGLEPMAQVADTFVFFLTKQPDGSPWPKGTKLYAEPGVKELRDELASVKRRNVHALASLGEAREERDKLRALANTMLQALQLSYDTGSDSVMFPYSRRQVWAAISAAKEHGL